MHAPCSVCRTDFFPPVVRCVRWRPRLLASLMMACFGSLPFTAVLGAEAPGVGISGLAQLSDVVVTGTRTEKARDEAPVRTEVVDHEEIQATGARTLKEALANIANADRKSVV